MNLKNKKKHYVKIDTDTESDKIYSFLDEAETNEEDDMDNLLNNLNTELVLENNFKIDFILYLQSNNMLILEANIYLDEDTGTDVNLEKNNVHSQQEKTNKGKVNGKEKTKKKKYIECNWGKGLVPTQKQQFSFESKITHPFPEHETPFNVFLAVANLDIYNK